jgi:ribosome biogenesis GTPase
MYDLPEGGHIIDTPGIRELGVIDIRKDELSGYYPEMKSRLQDCKYNNCLHFNEPGCAIKEAILQKEISEERYINYLKIMETIDEKKY